MDILGGILVAFFVGLLLFTALTFGFAIITACVVIAAITTVIILAQSTWRRWRFTRASEETPPRVIEGEYQDISHKHGEEI